MSNPGSFATDQASASNSIEPAAETVEKRGSSEALSEEPLVAEKTTLTHQLAATVVDDPAPKAKRIRSFLISKSPKSAKPKKTKQQPGEEKAPRSKKRKREPHSTSRESSAGESKRQCPDTSREHASAKDGRKPTPGQDDAPNVDAKSNNSDSAPKAFNKGDSDPNLGDGEKKDEHSGEQDESDEEHRYSPIEMKLKTFVNEAFRNMILPLFENLAVNLHQMVTEAWYLANLHTIRLHALKRQIPELGQTLFRRCLTFVSDGSVNTRAKQEADPELYASAMMYIAIRASAADPLMYAPPRSKYMNRVKDILAKEMETAAKNHIPMNFYAKLKMYYKAKNNWSAQETEDFFKCAFGKIIGPITHEMHVMKAWVEFNPFFENNIKNNLEHFQKVFMELLEKLDTEFEPDTKGVKRCTPLPYRSKFIPAFFRIDPSTLPELLKCLAQEDQTAIIQAMIDMENVKNNADDQVFLRARLAHTHTFHDNGFHNKPSIRTALWDTLFDFRPYETAGRKFAFKIRTNGYAVQPFLEILKRSDQPPSAPAPVRPPAQSPCASAPAPLPNQLSSQPSPAPSSDQSPSAPVPAHSPDQSPSAPAPALSLDQSPHAPAPVRPPDQSPCPSTAPARSRDQSPHAPAPVRPPDQSPCPSTAPARSRDQSPSASPDPAPLSNHLPSKSLPNGQVGSGTIDHAVSATAEQTSILPVHDEQVANTVHSKTLSVADQFSSPLAGLECATHAAQVPNVHPPCRDQPKPRRSLRLQAAAATDHVLANSAQHAAAADDQVLKIPALGQFENAPKTSPSSQAPNVPDIKCQIWDTLPQRLDQNQYEIVRVRANGNSLYSACLTATGDRRTCKEMRRASAEFIEENGHCEPYNNGKTLNDLMVEVSGQNGLDLREILRRLRTTSQIISSELELRILEINLNSSFGLYKPGPDGSLTICRQPSVLSDCRALLLTEPSNDYHVVVPKSAIANSTTIAGANTELESLDMAAPVRIPPTREQHFLLVDQQVTETDQALSSVPQQHQHIGFASQLPHVPPEFLDPRLFDIEDVTGDGHCMFHACARAMGGLVTYKDLRKQVADFMVEHRNDELWNDNLTIEDMILDEGLTFEQIVQGVRTTRYGGDPEMKVLEAIYDTAFAVFQEGAHGMFELRRSPPPHSTCLCLLWKRGRTEAGNHYGILRQKLALTSAPDIASRTAPPVQTSFVPKSAPAPSPPQQAAATDASIVGEQQPVEPAPKRRQSGRQRRPTAAAIASLVGEQQPVEQAPKRQSGRRRPQPAAADASIIGGQQTAEQAPKGQSGRRCRQPAAADASIVGEQQPVEQAPKRQSGRQRRPTAAADASIGGEQPPVEQAPNFQSGRRRRQPAAADASIVGEQQPAEPHDWSGVEHFIGADPGSTYIAVFCHSFDKNEMHHTKASTKEYWTLAKMTKHKQWEKNLRAREESYRDALNALPSLKTINLDRFTDGLRARFRHGPFLWNFCREHGFRKWRFKVSCAKKKAMLKILQKLIGDKDPQKCCVGLGDWSNQKFLRGKPKAPLKAFRKALHLYVRKVVDIDEHRTSKICSHCRKGTNVKQRVRTMRKRKRNRRNMGERVADEVDLGVEEDEEEEEEEEQELEECVELSHEVVRCDNNECKIWWQRDVNASRNMLRVLLCIRDGKERPPELQRANQAAGGAGEPPPSH